MQSTSCEMPDWMTYTLESRLPGEISTTSIYRGYYFRAESEDKLKDLLKRMKEEHEKAGLKLNVKQRSLHLGLSLHGKQMGKKSKR